MPRTILTGANLLDGKSPPRRDTTVVVEGNQIVSVTNETVPANVPSDRVVDLNGRTIMPGMYVCHFHAEYKYIDLTRLDEIYIGTERPPGVLMLVAANSARNALYSGVTGVVGGACAANIDAQLDMAIQEGLLEGPRIMPASTHMNTTGHDNDRAKWWYEMQNLGADVFCDGPEEFRKEVRRQIKQGARMIKIFPTGGHGVVQPKNVRGLERDEIDAVVQAAHGRGAKVRAHAVWKPGIMEAIEAGVDVIDHGDEIDDEVIEAMVEHGTYYVPSMVFLKRLLSATADEATAAMMAPIQHDWDNMCEMLPRANAAGVRIVPGDDYGLEIIPHVPGAYAEELTIYAKEVGVDPVDVLRWATVNGAALSGHEHALGLIEEGRLADLLVVDGDPSADITLLQDPERNLKAIMKDGVLVKDELPA